MNISTLLDFTLDTWDNETYDLNYYSPKGHCFEIVISPNKANIFNIHEWHEDGIMTKTTFTTLSEAFDFFNSLNSK